MEITESYSDEELEAECHVLGTLLSGKAPAYAFAEVLPDIAFCEAFHAAAYYAHYLLRLLGKPATPADVWELVKDHPDAGCFGPAQLHDVSLLCADPRGYRGHLAVLFLRAAFACQQAADEMRGIKGGARH